ncbi:MAG: flagellar biosynthetic protein FliR [Planctomycetes bacterium]|nr:flagellar biosynthetic protein FliR [Planctomycetota bacterium]
MELLNDRIFWFLLVLARVSAFLAALPIFGVRGLPARVRAGLALVATVFFASVLPPTPVRAAGWLDGSLLLVRETLTGLALGLAVAVVFTAVQQASEVIRILMGLAEAETIDPFSGEETQPLGLLLEMTFTVLFLVGGGHLLFLDLVMRSYDVFPMGRPPEPAVLAQALIESGSLMLVFALKLAAPLLAAFLLLMVALGVLARVLPEMNILLASLPLRIGLGFFVAAAFMPTLGTFTSDFGEWLRDLLAR